MEVVRLIAAGQPFHEGHAFAFDRVGDEHFRAIVNCGEVFEDAADGAEVVAVGPLNFPPERTELVFERPEIADGRDR